MVRRRTVAYIFAENRSAREIEDRGQLSSFSGVLQLAGFRELHGGGLRRQDGALHCGDGSLLWRASPRAGTCCRGAHGPVDVAGICATLGTSQNLKPPKDGFMPHLCKRG